MTRASRVAAVLACMALPVGSATAMTSIVVDVESGKVLSQDQATARWYPASTTKLMTAYIALRDVEAGRAALDMPVVMTRDAANVAPSKMGYPAGSVMRLDNALRMLMVKSANDVAVAIAQSLSPDGSIVGFVDRMNAEAARLGMADTRFINPNGLPGPGQWSSAKDLAILGVAIRREMAGFRDYFATEAIAAGDVVMKNYNSLLGHYPGADGMKTGYICASGFNLVASATRNDRTLVAVVLGAEGPIIRARVAAEILENGFKVDPAASTEPVVTNLPASDGAPADISDVICSPAGRTARANERDAEGARDEAFGSPYMTALERPLVTVPVALGGAAGRGSIEAGITLIAAYGIPIPTPRPGVPVEIETVSGGAAAAADVPTASAEIAPSAPVAADRPAEGGEAPLAR